METYSAKEVAEMLNVNPETVRRWIRSGKLETVKGSSNNENLILLNSLNSFLSSTKYAKSTAGLVAYATLSLASLGGAIANKIISDKRRINSQIPATEIKKWVQEEIDQLDRSIDKKQKKLDAIQQEIDEESQKRSELKAIMKTLTIVPEDK